MARTDLFFIARLLLLATLCTVAGVWSMQDPEWFLMLGDTDSYTRLTRVWNFLQTGDWFNNHFPFYNTPWGIDLHWTKPLDLCLLLSTAILRPFLSLKDALYYGSFLWNSLFLFAASFSIAWGIYPRTGKTAALFSGLLVLVQPGLNAAPNCIDHHTFCVFLQCLALGICSREAINEKLLGLVLASGLWVAIEFGLFAGLLLACLHFISPQKLKPTLLWMAIGITIFIPLERGSDWVNYKDLQRLSLVHAYIAWGAWLFHSRHLRLTAALLAIALFSYLTYFEILFQVIDPRIKAVWFKKVNEIRSVYQDGKIDMFALAIGIGAGFAIIACRGTHQIRLVLPGLLFYTPLTLYQIRHVYYLSPYVALSFGFLGARLLNKYQTTHPFRAVGALTGLLALPLALKLTSWPFLLQPSSQQKHIPGLVRALEKIVKSADHLFISPDLLSTAIVWHLGVGTVYAPYHQNVNGILDTIRFWQSSDEKSIHDVLLSRGITYVLIWQGDPLQDKKGAVFTKIRQGLFPAFLTPLTLPDDLNKEYLLLKVKAA